MLSFILSLVNISGGKAMININFTAKEIDALFDEKYQRPHPCVLKKIETLHLRSLGYSHNEICRVLRITRATLGKYLKDYRNGGIEKLKEINFNKPQSKLDEHSTTIKKHFENHPPATIAEAQNKIELLTGIKRSPSQIKAFLKRLGMRCLTTGTIPGKAITDDKINEQETFKEQKLEPRIEEAKAGKRALFFGDAAHFVHGAFIAKLWCFARLFMPTPSGRKRLNVFAALNAITLEIISITNETYIDSESCCKLLMKIAALNLLVPITLVLDNAKYQKNLYVQAFAESVRIELLYLPSYSPNLNLIERYWRFVKKQCLYSKYYPTFTEFKQSIINCIDHSHSKHKEKLDSLLTLKFQSFKKVQIMPF